MFGQNSSTGSQNAQQQNMMKNNSSSHHNTQKETANSTPKSHVQPAHHNINHTHTSTPHMNNYGGRAGQTTTSSSSEEKYPIHHGIQVHSNILQKLNASSSDMATNQKLMDVSDSDIRMLPLRFAYVSGKYSLCLKLIIACFFMLGVITVIVPEIPIFFVYLLSFLMMGGVIYLGAYIIYLSKQYVMGKTKKTGRYYRGMMAGWRLFEFLFFVLSVALGGVAYFLYSHPTFIFDMLQYIKTWRFGPALIAHATPITNLVIHTAIFTIFSFLAYCCVVFLTSKKASKLQAINTRQANIDQNREEVADHILRGE